MTQQLLFPFPHTAGDGGPAELLCTDTPGVIFEIGYQRMIRAHVEILFIQGVGCVFHPEITIGLADKYQHLLNTGDFLNGFRQFLQNIIDIQHVIDFFSETVDFRLLDLLRSDKKVVEQKCNSGIECPYI